MTIHNSQQQILLLSLYKTGISIISESHTHFIPFSDASLQKEIPTEHRPFGTIEKKGIIGIVTLGPNYLITIDEQECVFHYKEVDVWRITKTSIIPLKFKLCSKFFSPDETTDKQESDCEDIDIISSIDCSLKSESVMPIAKLTDQVNKTKDVLFSKLGIYTDDLKSSPSLSVTKKPVIQRLSYDGYYDKEEFVKDDDNQELHYERRDLDSIRLRRSITLRSPTLSDKSPSMDEGDSYSDISRSMLKKFEKQMRLSFNTKDFYYSDQIDISKDIVFREGKIINDNPSRSCSFKYNEFISSKLQESELAKSIIQGFVNSISIDLTPTASLNSKAGYLLLISKRSTKRAGFRYLRRGIDDHSNVANFVSTSQIFILDNVVDSATLFTKFDIIRGSIPLFFNQNPSSLKPVPYLTRSVNATEGVFNAHFSNLKKRYSKVTCISLVERSKKECEVGDAYYQECVANGIEICWFDFHEICKKMKFDNVKLLLDDKLENTPDLTVGQRLMNYGWFDSVSVEKQLGIFRLNCIDCLDRTNLVSKFISEFILSQILNKHQFSIENRDSFQISFNNLWADNGDFISRQYASTNALKGDYTRTSKRNYKGLMTDAWLTMSRYYSGYISDYFRQCFLEFSFGYQDVKIFEEFESTLTVIDSNDINEAFDKKCTHLQKALDDLKVETEDLIFVGAWNGFESSLKFNDVKLRDEVALVLTNKIVFVIKFTEDGIQDTLKLPVGEVNELQYGSYFKSTHTSMSKNPKRNIGLKFIMNQEPGSENTESEKFFTIKFPADMDYNKVKHIINLISKTLHSSTLQNKDIITLKEAQKKTNVMDVIEHKFKRMVWG